MSSTTVTESTRPIARLCLSPFNVRKDERDTGATAELEASILERGLIHPIAVHPMLGGVGARQKWGAFAGGRRYRSIQRLIARGALPEDWPIPVRVHEGYSDAQLIEASIAENMLRRDLRRYELVAGVRAANGKGDSVETIAAVLGREPAEVGRWLRLGQLADPIFQAYAKEEITEDEARAYGSTADQALQLAAFEALRDLSAWHRDPAAIRAWLKVGDKELDRLLRFVGDADYHAAGGRFEFDLFAEAADERGRVVDEARLRGLADQKLAGFRADLRRRAGRPELRFVPRPPQDQYGGPDAQLRVHPGGGADDAIALPEGEIVGRIYIDVDGVPRVDWWWESRKAKFGSAKGDRPTSLIPMPAAPGAALGQQYDNARQQADAAIKDEEGLTQDAIQVFRSLRRAILCAGLVDDARRGGAAGLDYLVWSQLRLALGAHVQARELGMRGFAASDGENEHARPHVAASAGARTWGAAIIELMAQRFMTAVEHDIAFLAYRAASSSTKDLAAAVAAGLALDRSLNAPGYRVPAHDALAAEIGLDEASEIRRHWTPTAELIALLPKSQQLAIAEPFVERAAFAPWSRLKAAELSARVTGAVTGDADSLRPALIEDARAWVHPLLRFTPADDSAAEPRELAEAAE